MSSKTPSTSTLSSILRGPSGCKAQVGCFVYGFLKKTYTGTCGCLGCQLTNSLGLLFDSSVLEIIAYGDHRLTILQQMVEGPALAMVLDDGGLCCYHKTYCRCL
jgi:hypothetical protein